MRWSFSGRYNHVKRSAEGAIDMSPESLHHLLVFMSDLFFSIVPPYLP